jgi:hypothetical protein
MIYYKIRQILEEESNPDESSLKGNQVILTYLL